MSFSNCLPVGPFFFSIMMSIGMVYVFLFVNHGIAHQVVEVPLFEEERQTALKILRAAESQRVGGSLQFERVCKSLLILASGHVVGDAVGDDLGVGPRDRQKPDGSRSWP